VRDSPKIVNASKKTRAGICLVVERSLKTCLLACSARERTMYVVYANAHSSVREHASFVVACIVFLYMKIFVCFIKQACLLAIVSKFGGG
jgi:hypothetical protein